MVQDSQKVDFMKRLHRYREVETRVFRRNGSREGLHEGLPEKRG